MGSLVRFELKKMLARRVAIAANVGVLVLLVGVMALNVVQTRATTSSGEIVSGIDAIEQVQAQDSEHAGAVTSERAAADIAAYQDILFGPLDRDSIGSMTDSAVYDLMLQTFGDEGCTNCTTHTGKRF